MLRECIACLVLSLFSWSGSHRPRKDGGHEVQVIEVRASQGPTVLSRDEESGL